jgi:hypothetical protein
MKRTKNTIFLAALIAVLTSCVEFYHPDLGSQNKAKYVVDGVITDQEGYQTVSVSMTSTFDRPSFAPLSYCDVKIMDNNGKVFQLDELQGGQYRVWMGKEDLTPGNSYKVNVLTPSGVEIESEFDQMPECPKIDSIYYIRKDYPTSVPYITIEGIQFYIDVDRKNTNNYYYRWDITETWEHHAVYPITWYKDRYGQLLQNVNPDYSKFLCWTTEKVKDIFTGSTENLVEGKFSTHPLLYVDNQTQRLTFGYSALISQFSLSKSAYTYWDQIRINSTKQGGLYQTQPLQIKGNLKSTTNPELEVLGFFGASAIRSKRVFVQNVTNFDVLIPSCESPKDLLPGNTFRYFIEINGVLFGLFDACVDCAILNGTTVKPDYWPY